MKHNPKRQEEKALKIDLKTTLQKNLKRKLVVYETQSKKTDTEGFENRFENDFAKKT